jgi:hypothetical protein
MAKAKSPKKSYDNMVNASEAQKRFDAVRKYVYEINKIVGTGPRGGLFAQTGIISDAQTRKTGQADMQAISSRPVGKGYTDMTKAGAIAARKAKVLRGTQNKAK